MIIPPNDTPTVSIAPQRITLIEGGFGSDGTKPLTVTIDPPPIDTVTITFTNSNTTEISTIPATPTITLSPTTTKATIIVSAIDDDVIEPEQIFIIALSSITSGFAQIDADKQQSKITVWASDAPPYLPYLRGYDGSAFVLDYATEGERFQLYIEDPTFTNREESTFIAIITYRQILV